MPRSRGVRQQRCGLAPPLLWPSVTFCVELKMHLVGQFDAIRRRGGVAIQVSAASLIYALVSRKLPQYGST